MKISRLSIDDLSCCAEILEKTELGQKYFCNAKDEYIGHELLKAGFEKNEIYGLLNDQQQCLGFMWVQINGIFNWFPFLNVIVIDPSHQHQGHASLLMKEFERICIEEDLSPKAFLIVGSYNQHAINFYEHFGYQCVGTIPNLFVKGIDELLMCKELKV